MHTLTVRVGAIAAAVLCGLGTWGLLIDAPYWRAVGDGLTPFRWTTWAAILLGGPAWLVARPLASTLITQLEWRFLLEHLLWASLAALQWAVILRLARLQANKAITIAAAAVFVIATVLGVISWNTLWPRVHRGEHIHWALLDWPLGILGVALTPIIYLWLQHRYGRARPNSATYSDTYSAPLRAPSSARNRER